VFFIAGFVPLWICTHFYRKIVGSKKRGNQFGCFCGTHPKGKISGLIPMAYQLILASASRFSVIKQFVAKRYRTT
jgi:hypothetical protein